jgi:hypothetical protein
MITNKLDLINEQTSPLFRIMWVNNFAEPSRRHFGNNICAFHIGNGCILTVAHNLRTESGYINSFDETYFQSEILPRLTPEQNNFISQYYSKDPATNKRYANLADPNNTKIVGEIFKKINFDTRWITLGEKNISNPYLIIQFRDNSFYNNEKLTRFFSPINYFPEPNLNRHTFLIELKMLKAFYSNDIALYKIVNTDEEIINNLPFVTADFSILDNSVSNFYCLQSSQSSNLGRLLNNAVIEGYSDNWSVFNDKIGGNYIMEGLRYLIRGYFRFGSSGAPYVFYDSSTNQFKVNAVQSEASPIQLSINNNREGNFQYVNAIASPLKNIQEEIENLLANGNS